MSEELSVYTFGGLRILKAGEPLFGIDSRKVEALFIYLVLAERPQPREILAELLWDDRSQQQAQANLRRVLSGLRKHFGHYMDITRTIVTINRETDLWLDARELRNGVKMLKTETASISPQIVSQVDEALRLYHGEFLAGFHVRGARNFDSWLSDQREYWRQEVLESAGGLIDAFASMQSYKQGVELARWAIQIDPLQESLHRQLMQMLALSGQRTDAIQQYEHCRQILENELGISPEPETEALFEAIASGAFSASESRPMVTTDIRIEGEERLLGLDEQPVPNNLPIQTIPCIGRESELASVNGLLTDSNLRLITIVGPGGMGKTRLALAAAHHFVSQTGHPPKGDLIVNGNPFIDGVFFVPLIPVKTLDGIILALAEQLELKFLGDSDPLDQILKFLGSRHLLLILDGFEHLMAGVDVITAILQHAPNTTLLVTSRERLIITGESVFRLGNLSYPDGEEYGFEKFEHAGTEFGAIELFKYHARLIYPDWVYDQNRLTKVIRICQLVQGMPLAIVLAVSWIETLPLDELAEAINQSLDILTSQQRDMPAHQRSVRAAFDTSWQQLATDDQAVFSKLSIFRSGFDRKAATVIAGANPFILRTLIEKSLIVPVGSDRYELHELLRQFAEEKLAVSGALDVVQQAHSEYYLGKLRRLEEDVKGRRQVAAFKEIDTDLKNISQAWFWALEQDHFSLIDSALETLTVFCYYYRRGNEAHELFTAALQKLKTGKDEPLLGRLLARHAWITLEYGLGTQSIENDLEDSRKIFKQQEMHREDAQVLLAQGFFQIRIHKDLVTGEQYFQHAMQICQALDDRFWMTILLHRIGYCYTLKDPSLFFDYTNQSLMLSMEIGNEFEAYQAQSNLGAISQGMGDSITSEQFTRQALASAERIGLKDRDYFTSLNLAVEWFLRGDWEQMKMYQISQDVVVIGKVNPLLIVGNSIISALQATVLGDLKMAEQLILRSLELPGTDDFVFQAHWALAMVYIGRGNLAEASRLLSVEYRKPWIRLYPGCMTWSLPVAALILARRKQPNRAAQVLSLASTRNPMQTGWLRLWKEGATLRSELQQILGEEAFQEAWDRGMRLDLVETIDQLATELSGDQH